MYSVRLATVYFADADGPLDAPSRPIDHRAMHGAGCRVWSLGDNLQPVESNWPCPPSLPDVLNTARDASQINNSCRGCFNCPYLHDERV